MNLKLSKFFFFFPPLSLFEKGFLPSHGNSSIASDHNSFAKELNNITNVSIPTSIDGIAADDQSPNRNSIISTQLLGSTPLSRIGCQLSIDHYASKFE